MTKIPIVGSNKIILVLTALGTIDIILSFCTLAIISYCHVRTIMISTKENFQYKINQICSLQNKSKQKPLKITPNSNAWLSWQLGELTWNDKTLYNQHNTIVYVSWNTQIWLTLFYSLTFVYEQWSGPFLSIGKSMGSVHVISYWSIIPKMSLLLLWLIF